MDEQRTYNLPLINCQKCGNQTYRAFFAYSKGLYGMGLRCERCAVLGFLPGAVVILPPPQLTFAIPEDLENFGTQKDVLEVVSPASGDNVIPFDPKKVN